MLPLKHNQVSRFNLSFLILFASFTFLLFGCNVRPKQDKAKTQEAVPVKVAKVEIKDVFETLDYVGNIKAEDEVVVYPKVSGKISEKVKEESDVVNKGEPICYIDRDEVGLKFEKAPVESPLSGVVGRVYVDIGTNVDLKTPVALVLNMDKVKIALEIPEKYIPRLSLGQGARINVDAYPDREFTGLVSRLSPVVDLNTRSSPLEITLDNSVHYLKPGMFAKVNLIIAKHELVPVILKEAVIGKEPDLYVYVIEGKKAHLKKVQLGIRQGPYLEVKEGLNDGDVVVVMGRERLFDGAEVEME